MMPTKILWLGKKVPCIRPWVCGLGGRWVHNFIYSAASNLLDCSKCFSTLYSMADLFSWIQSQLLWVKGCTKLMDCCLWQAMEDLVELCLWRLECECTHSIYRTVSDGRRQLGDKWIQKNLESPALNYNDEWQCKIVNWSVVPFWII